MKRLLALENLAQFALGIVALSYQSIALPYWLWPVLFFSPDLGMLGYLAGPRIGAWTYNLFHHKAVAIALILAGRFASFSVLMLIGLVLFAHAAFDRVLGYGLKYESDFKHTHLGTLPTGRKNGTPPLPANA